MSPGTAITCVARAEGRRPRPAASPRRGRTSAPGRPPRRARWTVARPSPLLAPVTRYTRSCSPRSMSRTSCRDRGQPRDSASACRASNRAADLVRRVRPALPRRPGDHDPGRGDTDDPGEAEQLPPAHLPRLRSVPTGRGASSSGTRLSLETAVDLTRTGDLWLFRGRSRGRPGDPGQHQQPGQPRRHGGGDRRPAAADVARRARPVAARRLVRQPPARGAAARPAPTPCWSGRTGTASRPGCASWTGR